MNPDALASALSVFVIEGGAAVCFGCPSHPVVSAGGEGVGLDELVLGAMVHWHAVHSTSDSDGYTPPEETPHPERIT